MRARNFYDSGQNMMTWQPLAISAFFRRKYFRMSNNRAQIIFVGNSSVCHLIKVVKMVHDYLSTLQQVYTIISYYRVGLHDYQVLQRRFTRLLDTLEQVYTIIRYSRVGSYDYQIPQNRLSERQFCRHFSKYWILIQKLAFMKHC